MVKADVVKKDIVHGAHAQMMLRKSGSLLERFGTQCAWDRPYMLGRGE